MVFIYIRVGIVRYNSKPAIHIQKKELKEIKFGCTQWNSGVYWESSALRKEI